MPGKSKITNFFKPKGLNFSTESSDDKKQNNELNVSNISASGGDTSPTRKRKLSETEMSQQEPQPIKCDGKSLKLSSALGGMTSSQLSIVTPNIGSSWQNALSSQFQLPYFQKLNEFVLKEREAMTVFPSAEDVWSWTTRTNISDTRVVILGQDPYHGPGQAHGLCFSVLPGVPAPPSLVNIYKELATDIPGFVRPSHGYLAGWADQGVLLLNACLTVRKGQANSHKDKGWEKITDAVIKWISDNCSGVVFLLWGASAQKKAAKVDGKKHHLLKNVHPSPLSAHRGFLGCKHFSKCNELLKKEGKKPIDWTHLPTNI